LAYTTPVDNWDSLDSRRFVFVSLSSEPEVDVGEGNTMST